MRVLSRKMIDIYINMRPIIVICMPQIVGCSVENLNSFGYNFFYGDENIDAQWKRLEELRETGGVIIVAPNHESAIRELLDPYIGEDGRIKDVGCKMVYTKEHGEFAVVLFYNSSEVMSERLLKGKPLRYFEMARAPNVGEVICFKYLGRSFIGEISGHDSDNRYYFEKLYMFDKEQKEYYDVSKGGKKDDFCISFDVMRNVRNASSEEKYNLRGCIKRGMKTILFYKEKRNSYDKRRRH